MTLMSDAAANATLAMQFGASHASQAPDNLEFALFAGDPRVAGVEMDSTGGYAPVSAANDGTTWPDAPSGRTIVSAPQSWTPTGPWEASGVPAAATHWMIRDADTGDVWHVMPLPQSKTVLDSSDAFSLVFAVNVPTVGEV